MAEKQVMKGAIVVLTRTKRIVYGCATLLIFLVECLLVRTSGFWRQTFGDLLVVMLIYAFVRILLPVKPAPLWLASGVCLFAFGVELSQYFRLIERLGLAGERLAHLTIGSTFDFGDLAAYLIGCLLAWGLDAAFRRRFGQAAL